MVKHLRLITTCASILFWWSTAETRLHVVIKTEFDRVVRFFVLPQERWGVGEGGSPEKFNNLSDKLTYTTEISII
jgi:hypothetical protein